MFVLLFFTVAALFLYQQLGNLERKKTRRVLPQKPVPPRLIQSLEYANRLVSEKKYLLAEKAYLQVLKLDHKNLVAYTQLGMVYTRLNNYEDAKECFLIATQIAPSAATYHNLGLAYLESRNHIKAIAALEKALIFESIPSRYIDLAKAYQKMLNTSKVVSCLEKVVELDPSVAHLGLLAGAYKTAKLTEQAKSTYKRILEIDPNDTKARQALGMTPVEA